MAVVIIPIALAKAHHTLLLKTDAERKSHCRLVFLYYRSSSVSEGTSQRGISLDLRIGSVQFDPQSVRPERSIFF